MGLDWLRSAVVCDGVVVCGPLDPDAVGDADLPDVCKRMHAILETIEQSRCEGRLIPGDLFDRIDTLASRVTHGPPPHWAEWAAVVSEFGVYYGLDGSGPIRVDPEEWRAVAEWISGHS
jgi:hypothetical protein